MKDDFTTDSHYLTYAVLFKMFGECKLLILGVCVLTQTSGTDVCASLRALADGLTHATIFPDYSPQDGFYWQQMLQYLVLSVGPYRTWKQILAPTAL